MSSRNSVLGVLFTLLALCHPCPRALAGSVKGSVIDPGTDPVSGIPAVVVRLRLSNGTYLEVQGTTDTDGAFTLDPVPEGNYTVVLDKVGYVPRPNDAKTLKVDGPADAGQMSLLRALASADYYQNLAGKLTARAPAGEEERAKAYSDLWNGLRVINLPPSSKAAFAAGLAKRDESVTRTVPEIGEYVKAQPDDIRKAEAAFEKALTSGESLPSPTGFTDADNGLKIGPTIVADIVLQQARNTAVPKEKRKAFSREFTAKWEGSDAAKAFIAYQEAGLDKDPGVRPRRKLHDEGKAKKENPD